MADLPFQKSLISVAAAGLGAAVGGPLGGFMGVWLGSAMGHAAGALIGSHLEEFGKEAGKKLLEAGGNSLSERLEKEARDLEEAFRDTLRLSLGDVKAGHPSAYQDWFDNWELALKSPGRLNLNPVLNYDVELGRTEDFLRRVLEELDTQGSQIKRQDLSILRTCRTLPTTLFAIFEKELPGYLQSNFETLITSSKYEAAWKRTQSKFTQFAQASLERIEDATGRLQEGLAVLPAVAQGVEETKQIVRELRGMMEDHEDTAVSQAHAMSWENFYEDALSKGAVIYEDPWAYWHTDKERGFKQLLQGRNNDQFALWNNERWPEVIDLWKPLEPNEYFNIAHPYWQDKPYFRCLIHQANCGLFVAHAQLAASTAEWEQHYRAAIHFLYEVLKEHPYAMLGGSRERLSVEVARTQNQNFQTTLDMARSFLNGWGGLVLEIIDIDATAAKSLENTVNRRLHELQWVLERHPVNPQLSRSRNT